MQPPGPLLTCPYCRRPDATSTDTILRSLGAELHELRHARGWGSNRAVAELRAKHGIDISKRTLASYEQPSRILPLPTMIALADLYEISLPALWAAVIRRAGSEHQCQTCRRPS